MLNFIKLKLSNFCQFEVFDMDFRRGMTQVAGPNGSGKTTVFRALVYALTGWNDPSWGTQADLQKDDVAIPGYVELTFTLEGEEHVIKRFAGSGTKLNDTVTKGGALVVKNRKAVNAWLERYLPVSTDLLAQLMWVRQGKVDWLLNATASQINTFLAQIFDTKFLEDIRKHLKNACDKVAHLRGDFDLIEKESTTTLETAEKLLAEAQAKKPLLEAQLKELQGKEQTLKLGISKADFDDKEGVLLVNLQFQESKLRSLSSVLPAEPVTDAMVNDLKYTVRVCRETVQTLERQQQDLLRSQAQLQKELEIVSSIAVPEVCEACGQTMTPACKEQYVDKVVAMKLPRFVSQLEAVTTLESALANIEPEKLAKQLEHQRADLKAREEQLTELEGLQSAYFTYVKAQAEQKEAQTKIAQIKQDLEVLRSLPILEGTETATSVSLAIQEAERQLNLTNDNIISLVQTIGACRAQIEAAQRDRVAFKRNEKVRKLFSTARDVLSQGRAQARYISSKVSAINENIAHFLDLSEMPFTLYLDPAEHVFKFKMSDSDVEHQAGMLSGAQQAAAAIAVQMALVTTALPDLNVLLIDEADAALSTENKFIAARMFRSLNAIMTGNEGVLLVISQSEAVTEECDFVVQIET